MSMSRELLLLSICLDRCWYRISIAIIVVVNGLGIQLNNAFTSISTQLK